MKQNNKGIILDSLEAAAQQPPIAMQVLYKKKVAEERWKQTQRNRPQASTQQF